MKLETTRQRTAGIVTSILLCVFLLAPGSLDEASARQSYAGFVLDANTGKVLYSHKADARRYPASLTKMMTLYVLFGEMKAGRLSKSSRLTVSRHAAGQAPSKLGLKPGQTISVENAIKALVTKSANDVAVVVAEAIGKTESAFARRMTRTARRIGMKRTTFRNASGLPNSSQVTTARDMATLGLRLQRDFPEYYRYFSIRSFTYKGRKYRTHNRLLGRFKGTDGIKTGYTRASGFNLTASVRRGRKHIIGVVLGGRTSRSRDAQMRKILSAALPRASTRRPAPPKIASVPIPVPNPKTLGTLTTQDLAVPPATPEKPTVITSADTVALGAMVQAAATTETDVADAAQDDEVPETPTAEGDANASDGTWSIQIGAFHNREDARRRLEEARKAGVGPLRGKKAVTLPFSKQSRTMYRARFAGFDQTTARRACDALARKSISCFTLAP